MSAQIIDRTETGFTLQVTIPYHRSMLDFEETLQQQLNEAGALATQEGLPPISAAGYKINHFTVVWASGRRTQASDRPAKG